MVNAVTGPYVEGSGAWRILFETENLYLHFNE